MVLLRVGFTQLPQSLRVLVSSYLTFSPLPCGIRALPTSPADVLSSISPEINSPHCTYSTGRYPFCGTFLTPCEVAIPPFTGNSPNYGPPCPAELGLSSPHPSCSAGWDEERPSVPLRLSPFLFSFSILLLMAPLAKRSASRFSSRGMDSISKEEKALRLSNTF